ncbi:hypothetical protein Q7P37_010796 [Cladosporium fusiforme]
MQKLKKVFSPGSDKDDELMYGNPRESADKGSAQSPSELGYAPNRSTGSPTQDKDHGISRQITNPDGDKYDEQRHGKPTTSTEPQASKVPEDREAALASNTGREDASVKRQVLDPTGNKRDETGYGATGFTGKNAEDTKNISSRPNELGSVPPSNDRYGSTTAAAPGTAITTDTRPMPSETASRMSMKSGVVGSADQRTSDAALKADGITGQDTPKGAQGDSSGSNFSRNAALAGAGAAAGAGGIYATRQRRQSRTSGDPDIEEATYTDRSFPLRGGATSHLEEDRPASSVYSNEAAGPSSTSAYIDPSTSGSNQKEAGGLGYGSGSAAVAGAGAGAVGAAATKEKLADHSKHSHVYHGDPCEDGPHSPADKTLPHVPGPHNTVAANLEDPHVPGEFPSEDGTDPHGNPGAGGFGRASRQPSLLSSTKPFSESGANYPMQSSPSEKVSENHHNGRNAALAGGAGAAGLGAYAATRDRGSSAEQTSSRDVASPSQQAQTSSATHSQTPQQRADDLMTGTKEPEKEHHYGKNAAVAGGSGLAGAAAYTAYQRSKDRDDPVSPTQTQGTAPRDSPITGTSQTQQRDVTDSTPSKGEKEHHYGRNAALAGGAGAAGYGAYEYSKDRGDKDLGSKAADPYDTYRDAADPSTQPDTSSHATTAPSTSAAGKADPYTAQQQQQASPPQKDHHYGRNAAMVGGAGAAGAAGYSALQSDRGDTGPASKTIGRHESNAANILDPRVRPEPEKMKDHTTAGPWQSDTLNKLDPKVESNPEKADIKAHGYASGVAPQAVSQQQQTQQPRAGEEDKDHHYGRNAALAGGVAGAGAAAGYGASRAQQEGLSEKEQEKLAKEQEKQAKHDAKEAEKQAKHDDKHAKKEAEKAEKEHQKEVEKAQKKQQKEAEKEAEKAEKQHQKELEKIEKKNEKEAEKAEKQAQKDRAKEEERLEKQRSKEQDELEKEKQKEDSQLAAARDEEAERKHNEHEHNKLHKTPPEEREKKGGIFHRIFHHKAHDREGVESGARQSGSFEEGVDESRQTRTAAGLEGGSAEGEGFAQKGTSRDSGIVTEKNTGLPMNVGKYGSGAGGTDGGEHIHGYQGETR